MLLVGLALSLGLDFSEVEVGLRNERGWLAAYADFNADKANDLLVVRDSGAGRVCSLYCCSLMPFISVSHLHQQVTKRTCCCGNKGCFHLAGPS